jgi:hypothetical protein
MESSFGHHFGSDLRISPVFCPVIHSPENFGIAESTTCIVAGSRRKDQHI